MKIEIIIKGEYEEDIIKEIAQSLLSSFGAESRITVLDEDPPRDAYSVRRAQYNASRLLTWVLKYKLSVDSYMIGLLDYDAFVEGLNFVFGIANPFYKVALVFTYRLHSTDRGLYEERIKKEVFHEFGHLLGLRHCDNRRCVMSFSNSIFDTDYKSWRYCEKCIIALKQGGIDVNEDAITLKD